MSKLSTSNKLLIYKTILKPYGDLALQVGGVTNETVKYGCEFCGTSTQESLLWQGPEAIVQVNYRPILSSKRVPHFKKPAIRQKEKKYGHDTKTGWPTDRRKLISTSIWTCGIQLWGAASTSNIEILERFQSKALRMIVDAPWYVPNMVIRRDLQVPTVKEEIRRYSSQYSARLSAHPNNLIVNLIELPDNRRLRRHLPNNLPTRFLV
jgi:hypothetical protein